MSGYRELKAQANELMKRAEEARQAELETVLQEVRTRVAEYGLTPRQIFGRQGSAARTARKTPAVAPKYRDPNTGATWSGRGREPAWIKGKRRERFLIERQEG
ncbi:MULTISPECIES: H-NS family nucleoid-associated regulatory protein [unclassified Burkholderia]|uniref:H-NS histone family protein n=1 Tax=unclassified Burkholderia TaxID=2613784 RepID=UPI000F56DA98|nr:MULTISPECIES: H-NS histone family protein [unclassified Burkholderia]MCR4469404.1 H-NS histone family protein [Burkholderia sp. SCN-KJ]RQR28925.1 H-NS histone family protein [Burkholderia sp. Bp9131]RQR60560.1 H-NS histone family protein [Burkholderia sp. Bp9015]RQR70002.1 H-NS histone family protein [Burkholderia sp. Bp9011]RQR82970.1 H-NS histone family protein [Burkholderia sp. Bp9010]